MFNFSTSVTVGTPAGRLVRTVRDAVTVPRGLGMGGAEVGKASVGSEFLVPRAAVSC